MNTAKAAIASRCLIAYSTDMRGGSSLGFFKREQDAQGEVSGARELARRGILTTIK